MKSHILLWSARITGTLLLAFLLFMLIGHLTGDANGPNGMTFSSGKDALAFALFPCCTIVGLALAYRWELIGGATAVGSMVALFILRTDLVNHTFMALTIPALLYVVYGWLQRKA